MASYSFDKLFNVSPHTQIEFNQEPIEFQYASGQQLNSSHKGINQ